MNRSVHVLLALGYLLSVGGGIARSEVITFGNLPIGSPIPGGYGDLTWHNWNVVNVHQFGVAPVSSPNALFTFDGNASAGPAWIKSANQGTFTFIGADFAGLQANDSITASGYRNGSLAYSLTFSLSNTAFSFEKLNFQNIDSLYLSAFQLDPPGGIPGASYLMDNFTTGAQTAPEPGSLLLFGIGTAVTGLAAFRRHRRLKASPDYPASSA